jgi:hypothetical protein
MDVSEKGVGTLILRLAAMLWTFESMRAGASFGHPTVVVESLRVCGLETLSVVLEQRFGERGSLGGDGCDRVG